MATRRTHSKEFKQSSVEASRQPGASISGVAMAHSINANQLHKWRRLFPGALLSVVFSAPALIPVTIDSEELAQSSTHESPSSRIDIELGRARISFSGRVNLDILHTVLVTLRPR